MFAAYLYQEKSKCPFYERLIACCNWCDVEMLRRIDDHLADNRCLSNHQPLKEITLHHFPCTTPLLVACYLGRLDVVQHIVEKWNIDVNEPGEFHGRFRDTVPVTPLFIAVAIGNEKIISYLIGKGADLSSFESRLEYSEATPLHAAIYYLDENEHKKDIIRLLIQSGADPSAVNVGGSPMWTFFNHVTKSGVPVQQSSFALMVDMGMKLDQRCPETGRYVLHHWTALPKLRNSLDMVKYLHAQGVSIFKRDKNGLSPLVTAALGWDMQYDMGWDKGLPNCDVLEYLLEQPGMSRQDKIDALEIAGAMLFIRTFNHTVAQQIDGPTGYLIHDGETNKLYDMFESRVEDPDFSRRNSTTEMCGTYRSYFKHLNPIVKDETGDEHWADSSVYVNIIHHKDARCHMPQSGYWLKNKKTDNIHRVPSKNLFIISYKADYLFIEKAFSYWKRATQLRLDGGDAFSKATLSSVDFVEWTTMSELEHSQKGPIDCTIQACLVLLRIFKSSDFSFVSCCHDAVKSIMDWLQECKDSRLLDVSWAVLEAIRPYDSSEREFSDMKKYAFTGIMETLSLLEEIGCDRLNAKSLSRMLQLIDCPDAKQSAMETRWEKKRSCSTDYECTYFHVAIKLLEIIARRPEVINDEIKQQVKRLADGGLTSSEGLSLLLHTCRDQAEPLTLPIVSLLLEAGADADQVDLQGNSGLHYLGINQKEPLESTAALLLVRAGCNVNRVNKEGKTALDYFHFRLGETTPSLPSWTRINDN